MGHPEAASGSRCWGSLSLSSGMLWARSSLLRLPRGQQGQPPAMTTVTEHSLSSALPGSDPHNS